MLSIPLWPCTEWRHNRHPLYYLRAILWPCPSKPRHFQVPFSILNDLTCQFGDCVGFKRFSLHSVNFTGESSNTKGYATTALQLVSFLPPCPASFRLSPPRRDRFLLAARSRRITLSSSWWLTPRGARRRVEISAVKRKLKIASNGPFPRRSVYPLPRWRGDARSEDFKQPLSQSTKCA